MARKKHHGVKAHAAHVTGRHQFGHGNPAPTIQEPAGGGGSPAPGPTEFDAAQEQAMRGGAPAGAMPGAMPGEGEI